MFRSMFRVLFALAVALSLTLGVFSIGGVSLAAAASQAPTDSGYNPVASTPPDMGYCYPSGYNRNGWRCGWRLAMYPYNMGDYNRYCGYGYGYGYTGCQGYYPGWVPGTGGRNWVPPYNGGVVDYGGRPRYNPCYYNPCYNYNYNYNYRPCYNYNPCY